MGAWTAFANSIGIDHVTALIAAATLILTITISKEQRLIAERIHEDQKRLSQKQFLIEIFREVNQITIISDEFPWIGDVVKAVATLEFVGVAVECGLVDAEVVELLFRPTVLSIFEQIGSKEVIIGAKISGKQVLANSTNATRLYSKYKL